MGYYSAIKKNESQPCATAWMDLQGITLSEVSQTEKDKYYVFTYRWNLRNKQYNKNKQTKRFTDAENKLVVTNGEGRGGGGKIEERETSHGLRICLAIQGTWVRSLVEELSPTTKTQGN